MLAHLAPSRLLRALATIGGNITAIRVTGMVSFAALASMTGNLTVDAPSVGAPLLTSVGTLRLNGIAAADFPLLASAATIQIPFWSALYSPPNSFALAAGDSNPTTITTLSFPSLKHGGTIFLGVDGGVMNDPCPWTSPPLTMPPTPPVKAGNLNLTTLGFPLLGPGTTVVFGENPALPKCRADALLLQVGLAPPSTYETCTLAAACPP